MDKTIGPKSGGSEWGTMRDTLQFDALSLKKIQDAMADLVEVYRLHPTDHFVVNHLRIALIQLLEIDQQMSKLSKTQIPDAKDVLEQMVRVRVIAPEGGVPGLSEGTSAEANQTPPSLPEETPK